MKPRTLLTTALLAGCIIILQYHAVAFWTDFTGPLGAVWSLLLEGAALWLWSHAKPSRRALGALVTLLMLAGPLYQVSSPLIEDAQRTGNGAAARTERIDAIAGEIQTLDRALATYLNNSQTRQGWVSRIDHTQSRIEQLRTEQAALTAASAEPARMPWQRAAVIAMQALAIVIFQLVAVLCIGELRERRDDATPHVAVPLPNPLSLAGEGTNALSPSGRELERGFATPHVASRSERRATGGKPVNFSTATAKPAARAVA